MVGDLSMWQIIWDSGPVVKMVLILLVLSSIACWTIFYKKKKEFEAIKENNEKFVTLYREAKNLREILNENKNYPFSPFGAMFDQGYEELLKISEKFSGEGTKESLKKHFSQFGMGVIERALKKGVNESNQKLDHMLTWLASIGSVAPYIGLLGTVWGIINSFTGLADGGAGLEAVAPGIAEALIATAVGLFAAIPAVLAFNHFNNITAKWNSDMDSFGQEFLNMVERSIITKK